MLDFLNSIDSSVFATIAIMVLTITLAINIWANARETAIGFTKASKYKIYCITTILKVVAIILLSPTIYLKLGETLTVAILAFFAVSILQKKFKHANED